MDYTNQILNHTTSFVERGCGTHIQTTEPFWHLYKMQNKRDYGTHSRMVVSYLCEFMLRQKYKENDLFMLILNGMNKFRPFQ